MTRLILKLIIQLIFTTLVPRNETRTKTLLPKSKNGKTHTTIATRKMDAVDNSTSFYKDKNQTTIVFSYNLKQC